MGNIPATGYPEHQEHDRDAAPARPSGVAMPEPLISFDGLSNYDNINAYGAVIIPPDMTGDVGPDHYVQTVNALVRIFDKSGNPLTPPFKMSDLFAPLGTPCSSRNDGESTAVYDALADRWLLSQYCTLFPPFRQMIAVSKTGDPTGEYYVYEFVMPSIRLNDLAKFGVWPDAYYVSTEEFTGSDYAGTGMFAFDRAKMLAGDPSAGYIYFSRHTSLNTRLGNLLPSDLDGLRPPPQRQPNTFIGYTATEYGDTTDAIRLFDFHADFADPASSSFVERSESPLPVAAFDPTSPDGRADITQPAPGEKLDANSDRLNYRAAYRNLGSRETIVVNQTVRLSQDPYRAGVRVYELSRTSGSFSVREQSTIGDTDSSRWIGTAAEDHLGNIAVGYNFVTDTQQPSVRYAGRLVSDPPGTFLQETPLINGTGVQKAYGWRWGDYSGMSIDPSDDCTFWMTGEYYTLGSQEFSDFTWLTRVGAFRFPECKPAQVGKIAGAIVDSTTGNPVRNAIIEAAPYSRVSSVSGNYGEMAVLPGTYTVTAAAAGYRSQSVDVDVGDGETLIQDFSLAPEPVFAGPSIALAGDMCPTLGPAPGDAVTVNVTLRNTGLRNTGNLVVRLLSGGGVTVPGPAQVYGSMAAGGEPKTKPFMFTVDPALGCGGRVTLSFDLEDTGEGLGTVSASLQTGIPRIALRQNFDRNHQAQLPQRWIRSSTGGAQNWTVTPARSQSGSKSAFSPDPIYVGVNEMVSPVFFITGTDARLTFSNWYEFETTFLRNRLYDGSVLEIRIGDGEWQDILAAGGSFVSGGYDGVIDSCCQNPLAGRLGWSGRSGVNQTSEFITTSVKLPVSTAGQRVQLRWRVGTDVGGFREGQYVDNVSVTDGFVCGCH